MAHEVSRASFSGPSFWTNSTGSARFRESVVNINGDKRKFLDLNRTKTLQRCRHSLDVGKGGFSTDKLARGRSGSVIPMSQSTMMSDTRPLMIHRSPTRSRFKTQGTSLVRPHSTGPRQNGIRLVQRTQASAKTWKGSLSRQPRNGQIKEKERPIDVFKKMAKSVRVISGICLAMRRYAQRGTEMELETIQANLKLFAEFDSMLAFTLDTSDLRIRPKVSERMQKVLELSPEQRSVKHIQSIQWLMKENDSFQGYPLTTQLQMCKCMEYQRYEAKRVILRQGHVAEAFYILLSGTILINAQERGHPVVKEVSAGGTFGETELLTDTPRQSTVVCKTDVELLVIFKEDFDQIIKGPQLQQKERHIDYLKSLPLFANFPVEKLRVSSADFFHKYFKKGRVIVSSTKENEYIIIVQSGVCRVMAEITRKRPNTAHHRTTKCEMERLFPDMSHVKEAEEKKKKRAKSATLMHWEAGEMRKSVKADIVTGCKTMDTMLKREDTKRFISSTKSTGDHDHNSINSRAFVVLSDLHSGDVFGLESMFSEYPMKVMLVSDGAECIFISRKLFIKQSNPTVLQNVTDLLVTFPTEEYVTAKLSEAEEWAAYKRSVLAQVLCKKKAWPHR